MAAYRTRRVAPVIDLLETEPGVYSVLLDGASFEARVCGDLVIVNGRPFPRTVGDPREWKRATGGAATRGPATLSAAMPGKVVRVLVREGDEVEAGQCLAVVEAMKMQNELKAPQAGRVRQVRAKENDSVNAGAVLVVLEPKR